MADDVSDSRGENVGQSFRADESMSVAVASDTPGTRIGAGRSV